MMRVEKTKSHRSNICLVDVLDMWSTRETVVRTKPTVQRGWNPPTALRPLGYKKKHFIKDVLA